MVNRYAKAYTEVLEILSYFSKEEYSKIPSEKIEFYKENMDKNYKYKIDPELDLSEQYISKEANAIFISLYRDYFATEKQKGILEKLLKNNQIKLEQEKREKYDLNVFEKKYKNNKKIEKSSIKKEVSLEKKEKSIFKKIINKIKNIFLIK